MTGGTLVLVLVAAAAHATWNTASKWKRGDTLRFVWSAAVLSAVLCVPVATVMVWTGHASLGWPLVAAAAVSGVLHVVYAVTLQTGYDRADLGVVYPVARGTGPVLTVLLAVSVLGEHLTRYELLGAAAIVAGVVIVAGNPLGGARRRPLAGVAWGAATGATIAAYTLWDGYSVTSLHVDPVVYFAATLVVETVLLTRGALRAPGSVLTSWRDNPVVVPTIAVLSPLAYVLVLVALRTAPVAVVAPLRESSIVLASLLAWWLFDEGHLVRRLVGAAVVLVGIVAVGL